MKKETRLLHIKNMVCPRCITGLFSVTEGITIEQHIIVQKMEKIKEWLIDDEL